MGTGVSSLPLHDRIAAFLQDYLVPLGWLVILTSMFIAGDRGRVHQLFYVFLALPTAALICLRPTLLRDLTANPLFRWFVIFSVYTMITIAWSTTEDTALSLMRRPLYIALLFFAAGVVGMTSTEKLDRLTTFAAVVAAIAAAVSLAYFMKIRIPHSGMRLEGYGALYNPLLTAHVFGAFATFWLATWLQGKSLVNPVAVICLCVLLATLLATGSRTPLVGLAAALVWLLATSEKRRGTCIAVCLGVASLGLLLFHPEAFTQRGLSFRPKIWIDALHQIAQHPYFGHGYDADMVINIPGLGMVLADPHNMELGVLYSGGAVGLILWLVLYGVTFRYCWANRSCAATRVAAAWLTFGIGSGLTEGMAFMSRPKEHWYLIWLPFALIYGQWIARTIKARTAQ